MAVDRVEVDDDGARVVHVVTADENASACRSCGATAVRSGFNEERRYGSASLDRLDYPVGRG